MFWKKNRKSKELFTYESCNFRSSYRVYPSKEEPIDLTVDGKKAELIDIGAGGISFTNLGFKTGDSALCVITIPYKDTEISTDVNIVRISNEGVAHSAFNNIRSEDSEIIHRYMLEKQKRELREKRKSSDFEHPVSDSSPA